METNGSRYAAADSHKPPSHHRYGSHLTWVVEHQRILRKSIDSENSHDHDNDNNNGNGTPSGTVVISGSQLSLAELVAVSQHVTPCKPSVHQEVLNRIDKSVDFLDEQLQAGRPIYGITTGFGGSADTRTRHFANLQKSLLQHHHSAVLLPSDVGQVGKYELDHLPAHRLPRTWVRGAMLARCHSLMRGHSAVRRQVIGAMLTLLNLDFIPIVPLRGSISASGDLTPLSYIAGALEGNPGIYVDCRVEPQRRSVMNADDALRLAGLSSTTLGPKEGLGIMNGTTVSCAVATLGLHEAQYLALWTQALTGMCTEALRGSTDNYHPFIAAVRPHPGHIEAAANITRFLQGSQLAGSHNSSNRKEGLYQDRYALRTAGQWIAPCLEDLVLAASQLETELNSTTDNPLIDAEGGHVHHGGNFQAASVTMATEKVRLSLQMFGKLMFAQSSEVLNTMLNGDLPPNLCFDDPSLSFAMKGVDINMAAYMSELAFLANPVSSHVQNAEMGNQAINSLALISARYTMDAVEMVSLMCANHLFALCQALDLQTMYLEYTTEISRAVLAELNDISAGETPIEPLVVNTICHTIEVALRSSKSLDLGDRAKAASEAVIAPLWRSGLTHCLDTVPGKVAEIVVASISGARKRFATSNELPTVQFLSRGSLMLYRYVRCELRIPFHKGLVEHATYEGPSPEGIRVPPEQRELIGAQIAKIYQAIRSGHLNAVLVASLTCDSLAAAHDRTDREVLSDNMVHGCNHSTIPATL